MRPKLVDPKLLKVVKPKKQIVETTKINEIKIENVIENISVKWVLVIVFSVFIGLYLWDYVHTHDPDPNPELEFLPESIRYNDFFGKYTKKEKEKNPTSPLLSFNNDQLLLQYEHL